MCPFWLPLYLYTMTHGYEALVYTILKGEWWISLCYLPAGSLNHCSLGDPPLISNVLNVKHNLGIGILSWCWCWTRRGSAGNVFCSCRTLLRHQMGTFSALLALCEGNPPVTGGFPSQRPVTRSFDFFYLCLNKRLSKQSRRQWFETPSRS